MLRFSIIIVSWNALHHLKTFLPSVTQTEYNDLEIILADNASSDGSKQWVKQQFPQIKIVSFDKNFGYCGGNNRAVPFASGDVLLFLNNDVKVEPDWIKPLALLFNTQPEVAAAQPKFRSYKHPEKFEYAGAAGGFIDQYGFPFCRGRIFDTLENDERQYDDAIEIGWASGAALAIRKNVFQNIGGFDQDFEFHMEEIDLCWRLWNQQMKVVYCPESVVFHLGGGSLPAHSPLKLYYNYRNSLIMLLKNYATTSLPRFLLRGFIDMLSAMRELLKGRFKNFSAILKAHLHFWYAFGSTVAKRKKLQKKRSSSHDPLVMKSYSIISQYFVKGIKHFSELPN